MRFFNDLKKYNTYALYVAKAKLESEVSGSYLGWMWFVLEPFFSMIVYVIIFGYVFKAKEENYPIFVFIGVILWLFFNRMMMNSVSIVKSNKSILTRAYVPKQIVLLSEFYRNFVKLLFGLAIVLIMMIIFQVKITVSIIMAIIYTFGFFVFTYGLSTIFLHLGVFIDDLYFVVEILLKLLIYFSCIFFDVEKRLEGPLGSIINKANPMAFYISSIRNALIYNKYASIWWLLLWTIVSILLIVLGNFLIYKYENEYSKVV